MLRRLFVLGAATAGMADAAVHNITVGASDHRFQPDSVMADIGDTISFQFYPTNHSVVRMDQDWPCKPFELVNPKNASGGWWSKFHPVSEFLDPPPSWNLTITTTDPQYFYCSAPSSCTYFGMIGVINPNNSSLPLSTVANKAGQTDYSLSPGEAWLGEELPTPPKTIAIPSATIAPQVDAIAESSDSSDFTVVISTGAIVGIVVGVVVALALIGLLFYFVGHRKKDPSVKEAAPEGEPGQTAERPPVYADPRYSVMAAKRESRWSTKPHNPVPARPSMVSAHPSVVPAHPSVVSAHPGVISDHCHLHEQPPNRISELPAAFDPVEIYTPEPEDTAKPSSTPE